MSSNVVALVEAAEPCAEELRLGVGDGMLTKPDFAESEGIDLPSAPPLSRLGVKDTRALPTVEVLSLDGFFIRTLPGVAMPLVDSRGECVLDPALEAVDAGMPVPEDIEGRGDFGGCGKDAILIVRRSDGAGCTLTADEVDRSVGRLLDESVCCGVVIAGGRALEGVRSFDINCPDEGVLGNSDGAASVFREIGVVAGNDDVCREG